MEINLSEVIKEGKISALVEIGEKIGVAAIS